MATTNANSDDTATEHTKLTTLSFPFDTMGNMEKHSRLFRSFFHRNQCHNDKGEQYYLLTDDEKEAHQSCGTTRSIAAHGVKLKQVCLKSKLYAARLWTKIPLLSSLFSWIRRKNLILSLPDDVLVKIHEELPIIDAVCLALTCKQLSNLFAATLKEKDFEFPRYWAPSLIRSCSRYAGIVDICPCAAWTIRDRDRAVKLLKSSSPSGTQFGPFVFESEGRPRLEHTCHLGSNEKYDADVAISIYIDTSNYLLVHAKYVLRLTLLYASILVEPLFSCPHFNLAGSSTSSPISDCPSCLATISRESITENNRTKVLFEVTRDLGSCESSDDSCWLKNCRLTGNKIWDATAQWLVKRALFTWFKNTDNRTKGPCHRNSERFMKVTIGLGHGYMASNNWTCKDACKEHMQELMTARW
ncbi:unnamed protein product [Penicillium salamii]|uniref:F-box domain-containing protein n=1 Tax=Penicillium salamii TaxID=1612424 RepID=A0A9W4K3G3_9EURO|nr:unnamed protein product [Penicillium salamii]